MKILENIHHFVKWFFKALYKSDIDSIGQNIGFNFFRPIDMIKDMLSLSIFMFLEM